MINPQILVIYFIIHEVFELLLLYVFYILIENPENLSVEVNDKIKFELNPNRFPCSDEKTVTDLKNRFILTFFNIDLSQDLLTLAIGIFDCMILRLVLLVRAL